MIRTGIVISTGADGRQLMLKLIDGNVVMDILLPAEAPPQHDGEYDLQWNYLGPLDPLPAR